jgi:hypothetical protein
MSILQIELLINLQEKNTTISWAYSPSSLNLMKFDSRVEIRA